MKIYIGSPKNSAEVKTKSPPLPPFFGSTPGGDGVGAEVLLEPDGRVDHRDPLQGQGPRPRGAESHERRAATGRRQHPGGPGAKVRAQSFMNAGV